MEHAGAVETGGYLYGHADYATQEVNVVEATPLPPGSNASAASLRLAQAGRTARERALRRRTQGKLYVVGTWHTHPGGRGIPSLTDLATFREAYAIDHEHGVPSLFVIQGDEGMQVYLRG